MNPRPFRLNKIWAPWAPLEILIDGVVIMSSGYLVAWILATFFERPHFFPLPDLWQMLCLSLTVTYPLVLQATGYYTTVNILTVQDRMKRKLSTLLIVFLTVLVGVFITKTGIQFSRLWIVGWGISAIVALVLESCMAALLLQCRRSRGIGLRSVLIVGSGSLARRVAEQLSTYPQAGYRPVGYLREGKDSQSLPELRCLGKIDDIENAIVDLSKSTKHFEVWITLPISEQARIQQILRRLRQNLVDVRIVPDIFMYDLVNRDVTEILGLPVIGLTTNPHVGLDLVLKRLIDIVGSSLGLLLLAPVLVVCWMAVILTSNGGGIFRQPRHGLDGRSFLALKFRTMYSNSERKAKYQQASQNDPRITPVGRVLRRFSLDELPQLWNVVIGDMSLAGPRPHPVDMNISYWDEIDRYALRHRVKPGITGWAQVHGLRGETADVSLLKKRIEYDLFYIDNWSLALDIKILIKTLWVFWRQPNAY